EPRVYPRPSKRHCPARLRVDAEPRVYPRPSKRHCLARLRARAEPRVYPRPSEAALPCPFTGTCRAAGLPAHLSATLLVDEDGRAMKRGVRGRRTCGEQRRAEAKVGRGGTYTESWRQGRPYGR